MTEPHRQALEIRYPRPDGGWETTRFDTPFRVGRHGDCQVRIVDKRVSREHLEVAPRSDGWWVRDLASTNGTYTAGTPVHELPLQGPLTLRLGRDGPTLHLTPPGHDPGPAALTAAPPAAPVDRARRGLLLGAGGLLLALLAAGGTALYRYDQRQRARQEQAGELALNLFYSMKNLELQISDLEERLSGTARQGQYLADLSQRRRELAALRSEYDQFVETLDLGPKPENDRQQLILHIARVFGECELNMPADFMAEVERYIALWQGSPRLERAMGRLREQGFAPLILEALVARELPPQFLYLALQESNFNPRIVGPPTRFGHAKGMWQFIPATGARYGLALGPLRDEPVYDPEDERHDPVKSTRAAAHYLKDIYRTDAQASGLLVMASYNWGEGNIIRLIRRLPETPRERNFWTLLRDHTIPEETYDYVFYIVSAAVIGENPPLFGFDFPSPLEGS